MNKQVTVQVGSKSVDVYLDRTKIGCGRITMVFFIKDDDAFSQYSKEIVQDTLESLGMEDAWTHNQLIKAANSGHPYAHKHSWYNVGYNSLAQVNEIYVHIPLVNYKVEMNITML